jgi:hypothetical protein
MTERCTGDESRAEYEINRKNGVNHLPGWLVDQTPWENSELVR